MYILSKILLLGLTLHCQASSTSNKKSFLTSIIEQVNSADTTWTAGHNFDPSASKSSFKRLCGTSLEESPDVPRIREDEYNIDDKKIPKSFDARKKWKKCRFIGLVQDQGNCGSCWAVAITSVIADRFCISTKGKFRLPLSSDDLLTCCNECGHGCDGACPCHVWWHLTSYGIVTGGNHGSSDGCKPYSLEPCDHHINGTLPKCSDLPEIHTPLCRLNCSNTAHKNSYWSDLYKIEKYYKVNNSVAAIQKEIMSNGPVQTGFIVYEDFLTYKSGVYQHITGNKIGGHAVKIIGWGEENETPYWLVVNSWNRHWGSKGYFKIKRGTNECGFEDGVWAATPDLNREFDENNED